MHMEKPDLEVSQNVWLAFDAIQSQPDYRYCRIKLN